MPRYGCPALDCGGAQVRAHTRSLATVVTVRGAITAANVNRVIERARRFLLPHTAVVLDLIAVNPVTVHGLALLQVFAEDCRIIGVDWVLVADAATAELLDVFDDQLGPQPAAGSVHEALRYFIDVNSARRSALLPLLTRSGD